MTIMVHDKFNKESQVQIREQEVNCSGLLENVTLKVDQNEPAMEAWTGKSVRNWFNCLVKFRRIGYVAKKDNIKGNITERGFPAILVGYAPNSSTVTY